MRGTESFQPNAARRLEPLERGLAGHAVGAQIRGFAVHADPVGITAVGVQDHDGVLLDADLFAELAAHAVLRANHAGHGEELGGILRLHHLDAVEGADVDAPLATGAVLLADDGDRTLLGLDLRLDLALLVLDAIDGTVARADPALDAVGRVDDVEFLRLRPFVHAAAPDARHGALLRADRAADALVVDVVGHALLLDLVLDDVDRAARPGVGDRLRQLGPVGLALHADDARRVRDVEDVRRGVLAGVADDAAGDDPDLVDRAAVGIGRLAAHAAFDHVSVQVRPSARGGGHRRRSGSSGRGSRGGGLRSGLGGRLLLLGLRVRIRHPVLGMDPVDDLRDPVVARVLVLVGVPDRRRRARLRAQAAVHALLVVDLEAGRHLAALPGLTLPLNRDAVDRAGLYAQVADNAGVHVDLEEAPEIGGHHPLLVGVMHRHRRLEHVAHRDAHPHDDGPQALDHARGPVNDAHGEVVIARPRMGGKQSPAGPGRLELEVLEGLGELRQVAAARPGHEHHVLDPHPADPEIVQAGLDRHDRAGLEQAVPGADRRRLVDVEAHAVARPVEKADLFPVPGLGLVAQPVEDLLDLLMDRPAVHAVAHRGDAHLLRFEDRGIQALHRGRRLSLHHGASLVGEIVRVAGPGEHVQDQGLIRLDRPRAPVVRIAALIAGGDDGVLRDAVPLHQRNVDDPLQELARDHFTPVVDLVPADLRLPEDVESGMDRVLGRPLGGLDRPDLRGGLQQALGIEGADLGLDLDLPRADLVGQLERKASGHGAGARPVRAHHLLDHVGHRASLADRLGEFGEGQDLVDVRLVAPAADLQVVQDQHLPPARLDVGDRVAHEKFRGIEEVRVRFARRVDHLRRLHGSSAVAFLGRDTGRGSVHAGEQAPQFLPGRPVAGFQFQRPPEVLHRFPVLVRLDVDPGQVVMRKVPGLVARGVDRLFEPGDRLLPAAQLDQVRADVVVGIAEVRIDLDRALAFRD